MCDVSNTPAALRTARCSSERPAYWMGISQPANGTRRAPKVACLSYKDVRFNNSSLTPPAYRDLDSGTRQEAPGSLATRLFARNPRPVHDQYLQQQRRSPISGFGFTPSGVSKRVVFAEVRLACATPGGRRTGSTLPAAVLAKAHPSPLRVSRSESGVTKRVRQNAELGERAS